MAELAIKGGSPVRTKPWPVWPMTGEEELSQLKEVLAAVDGTDRLWGGLLPCPKATEHHKKTIAMTVTPMACTTPILCAWAPTRCRVRTGRATAKCPSTPQWQGPVNKPSTLRPPDS